MSLSRLTTLSTGIAFVACLAAMSLGCSSTTVNILGAPGDDVPTTVATEATTVLSGTVPASNYTLGFRTFNLVKDIDNVVQSESGYAQLVAGSTPGQGYAMHSGALAREAMLADVEAAYHDAATTGLLSTLTTLQLPATWFDLVGLRLDTATERTVMIRNTDEGVSSYQLLVIAFY